MISDIRASGPLGHGLTLNKSGAVYTPPILADWVAELLAQHVRNRAPAHIIDLACGDGALLAAAARILGKNTFLSGFDIDQGALRNARSRIPELITRRCNSLLLVAPERRKQTVRSGGYDAVLINPPWGADPGFTRPQLREMGYTLANGQFDTYDLFLELSLRLLKPGGVVAAIIPDSLFLPEHEALRRMLVRHSAIHLIARLGEGFFDGVYRGTTVIVVSRNVPPPDHSVACMRLTKEWRRRVLKGSSTLSEAAESLTHLVQQDRFLEDASVRFSIDLARAEEDVVGKITAGGSSWTDWFVSGRGVELSKTGRILRCPFCDSANPLPRTKTKDARCSDCDRPLLFHPSAREVLVRPRSDIPAPWWQPFIAGEDVDRYQCSVNREIRLGVKGINYKSPDSFAPRKLLVRKTGLGIKAAIDETGAYTNQVVFHYLRKPSTPGFAMNYVLGVLNSRVLLAYHLKSLGETEWRSHPYVTQKIIASLPIPKVVEGTWQWCQALAIADAVRDQTLRKDPSGGVDLQIERLCAGLFGLTLRDCEWVLGVLDRVEGMEPLRTLRLADVACMSPLVVG